ncbi:hypothetical protein [Brevundimonas diminuta]|uniref:hypothetical protein n=1 Tax=Brevundimonas diminuta TaxID=293 RepID=UPI003D003078
MLRSTKTLANLFAAVMLVIAAFMVAPAVDAAVCGPDTVIAAHQSIDADDSNHDDQGGDIHGHCHHPAERQSSGDLHVAAPLLTGDRHPLRDESGASLIPDRLKRPPRI